MFRTQTYHKRLLFLHSLEAAMTKFGGGINELEVDLLQCTAACLHQQRLENKRKPTTGLEPKITFICA